MTSRFIGTLEPESLVDDTDDRSYPVWKDGRKGLRHVLRITGSIHGNATPVPLLLGDLGAWVSMRWELGQCELGGTVCDVHHAD